MQFALYNLVLLSEQPVRIEFIFFSNVSRNFIFTNSFVILLTVFEETASGDLTGVSSFETILNSWVSFRGTGGGIRRNACKKDVLEH